MMQLPDEYLPDWAKTAATLLIGAGGAKWLQVWLENRRLTKRDFRETLLERIRELEKQQLSHNVRITNLKVEIAHLEMRNEQLTKQLELHERVTSNANQEKAGRDDVGEPS